MTMTSVPSFIIISIEVTLHTIIIQDVTHLSRWHLSSEGWIITSSTPFINIPNYPDIEKLFGRKGEAIVDANIKALAIGRQAQR